VLHGAIEKQRRGKHPRKATKGRESEKENRIVVETQERMDARER